MNPVKISIFGILFFCGLLFLGPYFGINLLSRNIDTPANTVKRQVLKTPSMSNNHRTLRAYEKTPPPSKNTTQTKKLDKLTEIEDLLK